MLDEMLAVEIAEQLRRRGWDVEAIQDRPDLRGAPDADVLRRLEESGHTLVTDNVVDFEGLHRELVSAGRHHAGLLFAKLPRSKATIGRWVAAIEATLRQLGPGADLRDQYRWLA